MANAPDKPAQFSGNRNYGDVLLELMWNFVTNQAVNLASILSESSSIPNSVASHWASECRCYNGDGKATDAEC
ncbi:hypothetical protein [Burkholderia orbicola]|uniref:hypothetical protein n=1 Tax=Burkholderia orbicola TaxID=2978683 RepID=UPI002FDF6793